MNINRMFTNKKNSLVSQIRFKISIRILACLILSVLTLVFLTFLDVTNNLDAQNRKLNSTCGELEEFIISQVLIGNQKSIDIKLNEVSELYSFDINWAPNQASDDPMKIRLRMPFNWVYSYNLKSVDGRGFGVIHIKGYFKNNAALISELWFRGILVLSFFLFLFTLLFPLAKKIPREMFLNPILDILSLLKNPESYHKTDGVKKITELDEIKSEVINLIEKIKNDSHDAAIGKMAMQVAHDIRSPLAALDIATRSISGLQEDHRLIIRNATQRINDIANNLLRQHRKENSDANSAVDSPALLISMLDTIISEKRAQYFGRVLQFDLDVKDGSHTVFVKVNTIEFKRMISNILNNSVEAMPKIGHVIISLENDDNYAVIKIEDNGCGIPSDVLVKLFSSDISFGKKEGHGLGLQHAYSVVHSWGGNIKVSSEIGLGTTVSIYLPLAKCPSWFVNDIKINSNDTIVVFDDDKSIHQVWSQRFNYFVENNNINMIHFYCCNQLKDFVNKLNGNLNGYLFLVDYEIIGIEKSGLDMIEELKIYKKSILVTSRYEEEQILNRCKKLSIHLLPKSMSAFIPIHLIKNNAYDAVLIDDDPLVLRMWEYSADMQGKKIRTFSKPELFFSIYKEISRETVIYIDSNLGNGKKGEVIAKDIYSEGFETIYLTTGSDASDFSSFSYLKGVIGKAPPWESL
jgi:signal transduction histidine kinase